MSNNVTVCGGIIDQRGMSAGQRFEVACVVREGWWDCYGLFMNQIVDLSEAGLTPASLEALALDLDEAGYPAHAAATRSAIHPASPTAAVADHVRLRAGARACHGVRATV